MENNSKIGIGFVGAGWMGATLMQRIVERSDCRIAALHQRSPENAMLALDGLGLKPQLYTPDFNSMIADPAVDAVFLCSPNSSHGPQSIAALEAGKHVFCEKPCATLHADFQKQLQLARANPQLVTFVNYLMNFDTMEQRVLNMVESGDFGTITQVQVNYRHPININGDKAWKLSGDIMGDAIGMGIIHALSVMLNIMTANGTKPTSVFATCSNNSIRGFEIPAIYNIQISFDNEATGFCFGNVDQANGYDAYHNIHGTNGGLIFDSYLDRPDKVRLWSNSTTGGKWVYPLDPTRCPQDNLWPQETTTPDSGDVVKHQTGACVEHF
ncbi:MAG: Gfo/Idh/MocA family oxidoreductase, partial [Verrucomicrobiaceae bacterium]|nr:Gfo/Idh/MocA family oxidoreductase [Verrucomicrobiaceae bacterium]